MIESVQCDWKMGDKPSKSHSDDESGTPHLARSDLHFDGAARLSFDEGSQVDADYHLQSRNTMEINTGASGNESMASPNSATLDSQYYNSFGLDSARFGSVKYNSPIRQANLRLATSLLPSGASDFDTPSAAGLSMESIGSSLSSRGDAHSSGGHADNLSLSSIEPPSPSTSSTKTVISVVPARDSAGSVSGRLARNQLCYVTKSEVPAKEVTRTKLTLGDILHQIEDRSKTLLEEQKAQRALSSGSIAHLQFLAQQSRYGTDANVKRRILTKLAECHLVDILVAVFRSLNFQDCFRQTSAEPLSKSSTIGGPVQRNRMEVSGTIDDEEADSVMSEGMQALRSAVTLVWNTSDKLATFCEQCVKSGIVISILDLLQDRSLAPTELHDRNRFFVARGCIGALANFVRMCDDDTTREACRSAGAVRVLQQYLRCSLVGIRTKALVVLSYIANESENDLIHTSEKNLVFAVKMLQSAIESENHYSSKYGYWAVEIMAGVNRLACYESNKQRLHAAGLLSLCIQLMDSSSSDDEILVATQTFWILCFNMSVRTNIKGNGQFMAVLGRLSMHATRDEIKRTALSALWVLNHRLPCSLPAFKGEKEAPRVLMLSHHTSRQSVLRVRNRLRGSGYQVHIDPDLRGCGMESAVDNVNRAAVVLVFMTNRLKNSPACRTELEYAASLKKPLILVRLHRTFVTDGWLVTAFGDLPVTDFVEDENFDTVISSLTRQVQNVAGLPPSGGNGTDTIPPSASSDQLQTNTVVAGAQRLDAATPTACTPNADNVASWNSNEVQNWLRHNGLDLTTVRLNGVTGELLLEMKRIQDTAPESFYTTLRTELQLDFVSVLKLSRALSKL